MGVLPGLQLEAYLQLTVLPQRITANRAVPTWAIRCYGLAEGQ